MATHSSILTWGIPWTEEAGSYSPRDEKESDTEIKQQQTCILKDTPDYSLEPCVQ